MSFLHLLLMHRSLALVFVAALRSEFLNNYFYGFIMINRLISLRYLLLPTNPNLASTTNHMSQLNLGIPAFLISTLSTFLCWHQFTNEFLGHVLLF
ncbi:hypothetical protein LXL04_035438 [Taraxacum kok-saghyz]